METSYELQSDRVILPSVRVLAETQDCSFSLSLPLRQLFTHYHCKSVLLMPVTGLCHPLGNKASPVELLGFELTTLRKCLVNLW